MTLTKLFIAVTTLTLALFMPSQASAINFETLNTELVKYDGKKLTKVKGADLASKKYVAFYYSAHWCPPCRAFTPDLVESYKKMKAQYGNDFELVFISSDKSEQAMAEYMEWGKMEWPAAHRSSISADVNELSASGIPYLVVIDKEGNEVLGKGEEKWVHPSGVLAKLEGLLKK